MFLIVVLIAQTKPFQTLWQLGKTKTSLVLIVNVLAFNVFLLLRLGRAINYEYIMLQPKYKLLF